jgi:hypothetical protein
MEPLVIRYAGRAAGAGLAYFVAGRKLSPIAAISVAALGWLAGGLIVDSVVKADA